MTYKISRNCINNIAEILPDAYVLDNDDGCVELVLQGTVDQQSAFSVAKIIHEDTERELEEYKKNKKQKLLKEVRSVIRLKSNVKKRVLCSIVNDAINGIV